MMTETVRISKRGRDQLIKLKKITGIENWNILCRWALCKSLSEPSPPMNYDYSEMSNIEMTWRTFGGKHSEIYEMIIKQKAIKDLKDPTPDMIAQYFKNHLHRGIAALSTGKRLTHIGDLLKLVQSEIR
jgi:DNA sulfur modification protein DndE